MIDIFSIPFQTENLDIISYKVEKQYSKKNPSLYLTVDSASSTYCFLNHISDPFFYSKGKQALIQAYYLYCFLITEARIGNEILTKDISDALGVDKETRQKIDVFLQSANVLWIEKTEHNQSVQLMLEANRHDKTYPLENYKYEFYSHYESYPHKRIIKKFEYKLPYKLWHTLELKGYTMNENSLLCEGLKSFTSISHNSDRPYLRLLNKDVYIPKYDKLKILPTLYSMKIQDVKKRVNLGSIIDWHLRHNAPVKFSYGRLYHAFHNTPKCLRTYLEYNGSKLIEIWDVPNACFVFLSKILKVSGVVNDTFIDSDELKKYDCLVRNGRLYEEVMKYVNSTNRDLIKNKVNAYKNDDPLAMINYDEHGFFKENFPSIVNALKKYPTYISSKDGKPCKYLQTDTSYVELYLMSSVCDELVIQGVTPFSLHDAIYVNENDAQKLSEKGIDVGEIFWEKYNSLSDDEVISLLKISRSSRLL